MNIGTATDHALVWSVVILSSFIVCGLLLGVMNRLLPKRLYAKQESRKDRPNERG